MAKGKTTGSKKTISKKLRSISPQPKRIHVIPQKGNWAVRREGAQRAAKVLSEKNIAVSHARSVVSASTVVVHRKDGTIEKRVKTKQTPKKRNEASK